MLVGFPSIFVADTKIIYGYNFVAPLNFGEVFVYFVETMEQGRSKSATKTKESPQLRWSGVFVVDAE